MILLKHAYVYIYIYYLYVTLDISPMHGRTQKSRLNCRIFVSWSLSLESNLQAKSDVTAKSFCYFFCR